MQLTLKIMLMLTLIAAFGLFGTSLILQDDRFLLVAVGHLCLAALLFFPIISRRKIGAFDPLALFSAYVVLGTIGNAYVVGFGDGRRRDVLMNGEPVDLFIWGGLCLAVAMLFVGLGYTLCQRRLRFEKILPNDKSFTPAGLHLAALMGLVVALLATVAYIQQTGGIDGLANLSRKRVIEVAAGDQVVYANGGYLRLVASLPMVFLYLIMAHYLKARTKLRPWQIVFLVVLLIAGTIIPFVGSSRSSIAYSLIGVVFVYAVFRRISGTFVIATAIVALTLFSLMTGLRVYANVSVNADAAASLEIPNPIVALAESGNGMSLSGTTLILDGVPERMDFKYGVTFFSWLVAPVPRSVWPGKPQISLGKEIKSDVLGQPAVRAGRPASVIAEGYINFGWIGYIAVAFAYGYLMRLATNTFQPIMRDNIFTASIYFTLFLNIPSLANGSLSQGTVRSLTDILPLYLICLIAAALSVRPHLRRRKSQRSVRNLPLARG